MGYAKNHRIVLHSRTYSEKRTDKTFSSLEYDDHQNNSSPLVDGGVCASSSVLDYMHFVSVLSRASFLFRSVVQFNASCQSKTPFLNI